MGDADLGHRFAAPFEVQEVKWLPKMVKGNRALAMPYIDARLVQERLDEVVGVANWQDSYEVQADGSVMCRLAVRINGEWVTKSDVGSPSEQPDGGDRLKAAFSDSLKRTAVKLGIGRYLYRIPAIWADYDPQKKQFVGVPSLPRWAVPEAQPRGGGQPAGQPARQPAGQLGQPRGDGQLADSPEAMTRGGASRDDLYLGYLAQMNGIRTMSEWEALAGSIRAQIEATPGLFTPDQLQNMRDNMRFCKPAATDRRPAAAPGPVESVGEYHQPDVPY